MKSSNNMLNSKIIYGILLLLIAIILGLYLWNNYQVDGQPRIIKPFKLPLPVSDKCGIENCHGLDITCGPNVAEVCTEMYQAGDNCRQFASCQIVEGKCTLQKSADFDSCKSCVQNCQQANPDDPIKFFDCESKCWE